MTDNFKIYKEYITDEFEKCPLEETDSYFAIELMRRGKDNPDMPAANVHFKNYYKGRCLYSPSFPCYQNLQYKQ